MISRRLFGKALAAAPAVMKAAASAAVTGPLTDAPFSQVGTAMNYAGMVGSSGERFDPIEHLRRQIGELLKRRSERRREYIRNVRRLDADLASNRSLSLSARIRLQAERDEQADYDRENGWLQGQLAELLGRPS